MTKKQQLEQEQAEAREWFKKHCPPGSTVFCILDHVSRSGMLRRIRVLVPNGNGDFLHPNHAAGVLTGYKQAPMGAGKGDGLAIGGCGMDMGFALVSHLSAKVYPDGFGCVGKGCPSNDHSNGDRNYDKHSKRRPHWHRSGDYALRHRWL